MSECALFIGLQSCSDILCFVEYERIVWFVFFDVMCFVVCCGWILVLGLRLLFIIVGCIWLFVFTGAGVVLFTGNFAYLIEVCVFEFWFVVAVVGDSLLVWVVWWNLIVLWWILFLVYYFCIWSWVLFYFWLVVVADLLGNLRFAEGFGFAFGTLLFDWLTMLWLNVSIYYGEFGWVLVCLIVILFV